VTLPIPGPAASTFLLYGAERSYFTGKVRPALRAKRVYFEELLANRDVYRDIQRRTGLGFIPVVVTPEDETWQDTSEILDQLEASVPTPALVPRTPVQRVVAYLLELYGDEFMILPAMHYRWTAPESDRDARGSFAVVTGNLEASNAFADRMSGALPFLGVNEATVPAIEAHLKELLEYLGAVFADQEFLLGDQMSLGDCGLMGPFYGHLYLDRTPGDLVRWTAPRVAHWIERMNHPNPRAFTGFLAGDALHDGVRSVLELIGRDAVPFLLDIVRAFETWADANATSHGAEELPRAIGMHATQLRGVEFQRGTSSYTLWMLQRVLDAYRDLDEAERKQVDAVLAGTGCEALLAYEPRHRLGKRDFKLVFETS